MIVERKNNEIVVKFSAGAKATEIQRILDYLRYEELTSNSQVAEPELEELVQEAKKDRWKRIKKEMGMDD